MSSSEKENLKRNATSIMTFANLVLLLSFIWYQAQFQERAEKHMENSEIHSTYKDNVKYFVPRNELQIELRNFRDILVEIKEDVKDLKKK